jgi:hypothetical protein
MLGREALARRRQASGYDLCGSGPIVEAAFINRGRASLLGRDEALGEIPDLRDAWGKR